MTNGNNDVRELEDLLTELEGQGALPVGTYAEEDDVVTQLMDAPLGEQEWMVQITPLDRRMMSTEQLLAELATGHLVTPDMLVWRSGMNDWAPASRMEELRSAMPRADRAPVTDATLASVPERRPAPLPPPAPVPPPRAASSAASSPNPLGRAPLPPPPSVPYGAAKLDAPPPGAGLSQPGSAFDARSSNGAFAASPSNGALSSGLSGAGLSGAGLSGAGLSGAGSSGAAFSPPPPPAPAALLPDLDSAFNLPPAAAVPVPPPVTARVNTQRPVAVDFSEMEPSRPAPMRILIGSGIAAAAMIAGTVYALSAGGVFESSPEPAPMAAAASNEPARSAAAAAPKAAEPAAAPAEPQTQPASVKESEPAPAAAAVEAEAAPEEKLAEKDEPARGEATDEAESERPASEKVAAKGEDPEEKPKTDDEASASDGDSRASSERGSRRLKASRIKKVSASDKANAPSTRRSKPRAAAVASAAPAPEVAETTKDAPGSTFNRDAAKTALDDAAAQARNCRPAGGQSGAGKVQVRYEPTGKVGAVSILSPQFDNTTTGDCVVMVFRRASIPAFTGSPAVVMNKNFEIP